MTPPWRHHDTIMTYDDDWWRMMTNVKTFAGRPQSEDFVNWVIYWLLLSVCMQISDSTTNINDYHCHSTTYINDYHCHSTTFMNNYNCETTTYINDYYCDSCDGWKLQRQKFKPASGSRWKHSSWQNMSSSCSSKLTLTKNKPSLRDR